VIIHTDAGTPYITVIDNGKTFDLQLHKYDSVMSSPVLISLDKRVLPKLIVILQDLLDQA
jgi:hypothetical protein